MRGFFGGLPSSSESAVRSTGGFFLGCVCVTRGGGADGAGGGADGRGDGARGTGAGADGRDACAGADGSGGGDG